MLNRFFFSFSLSFSGVSPLLAGVGGATFSWEGLEDGLSFFDNDPNRKLFDRLNFSRPEGLPPLGW